MKFEQESIEVLRLQFYAYVAKFRYSFLYFRHRLNDNPNKTRACLAYGNSSAQSMFRHHDKKSMSESNIVLVNYKKAVAE